MDEEGKNRQIKDAGADLEEHDARNVMYMTFKSGEEYFGLKIEYVSEIVQFQAITEIPGTEDYIKGLINLRGKVIPVMDVSLRLCQTPIAYNDRTCIIVINVKDMLVGLIVETIAEVVDICEDSILPPPPVGINEQRQNLYIYGVGKVGDSVKLLLDPDKLLNDKDLTVVEQANHMADREESEEKKDEVAEA